MASGKSYQPGNRLFDVAVGVLANARFSATRQAILTALSEKVGETCNIAYPDGLSIAYSDRIETKAPLRLQLSIGLRVSLYCTASDKLYLSTLPKSRRKSVIGKLELEQHAKNTITDVDMLMAELELSEKRQISIDNQELYDDVVAIAVPIKDKHGRFYSSLAIQAPASRISIDNSDRYLPLLREAAQELWRLADDD